MLHITALFFYQVPIFRAQGLSAELATGLFSISALVMVVTMPLLGRALDRFATQPVFACALLTMTASMLTLALVDDLWSAIVFGVDNAVIHTHSACLWPRFFGRRHLGSIQGSGQTIAVVGASIGPLSFGVAFDLFGSYTGALVLFSFLPVAGSLAILMMTPPARGLP